jgi:acyl-CoA thioester hydrolase
MQLPPLEPARAVSRSDLRVRFCETDLMGIVHHAQYLTYFEAGRVDWLRRRGITYTSWTAGGVHLPVVGASLKYRAPARFEDILTIETRLAELRWASLRYTYVVTRGKDVLAEGETRLACVDGSHVLRRLPPEVLAVLAGGEVDSPSGPGTV